MAINAGLLRTFPPTQTSHIFLLLQKSERNTKWWSCSLLFDFLQCKIRSFICD